MVAMPVVWHVHGTKAIVMVYLIHEWIGDDMILWNKKTDDDNHDDEKKYDREIKFWRGSHNNYHRFNHIVLW